jgi:TonB-linked SusC/RagA family outer membrane protein
MTKKSQKAKNSCLYKFALIATLLIFNGTFLFGSVYSQNTYFNFNLEEVTYEEFFKEIEDQSEFIIFYQTEALDLTKKISVKSKDERVEQVLDKAFKGENVSYKIIDRQIVIKQAEPSAIKVKSPDKLGEGLTTLKDKASPNQVEVEGVVTDATSGDPLPGVNIVVKGTTKGTITGPDGSYSIEVEPDQTLVFSFVGYEHKEVPVDGRQTINVSLKQSARELEQVVKIGYGVQKKRDLTGSVSQVEGESLEQLATPSLDQAIQGQVSGVQVTANSGAPGSGAIVRIRGIGTLNNADPLYVVDGMMVDDISFLSNDDVESIEVLKDASATAIYGSRGANGVILISTKGGDYDQEATFNVNAFYGMQQLANKIDKVNAEQYAMLANEVRANRGQPPFIENPDEITANTDWQDQMFRNAPVQKYQVSASGGSENVKYNVSGNYFSEDGILRGSYYNRLTLRINNEYKLTDNFRLGHNVSYTHDNRKKSSNEVFHLIYRATAADSVYNHEGEPYAGFVENPEAAVIYNKNEYFGDRIVGNLYMEYDLLEDLRFRSNLGLDLDKNEGKQFNPEYFVFPWQQNEVSNLNVMMNRRRNILWENTINFNKDLGDHSIDALAGFTWQDDMFEAFSGTRNNFPDQSKEFWYLDAGEQASQTNSNYAESWSMLSYLSRVNYSFLDRYLLTASLRVDGSSRFGENNRYGYFPSVALGWRISDEPFFDNVPYITNLKLRGSWGQTGNDKIPPYAGSPTVASGQNAVFGPGESINAGATLSALSNPDIKWETTVQSNVGLDLNAFDNRLSFQAEYYYRETKDILLSVPIPNYVGSSADPYINAANVANTGLDFSLGWKETRGDFSYNVSANVSTIHNEVKALGEGKEELFGRSFGKGTASRTTVGSEIGAFYGYKVVGVFQTDFQIQNNPSRGEEEPGDLRYKDVNGDGEITPDDRTTIGSGIPDMVLGLNMSAEYKGFDVRLQFNGVTGTQIVNAKKMNRWGMYSFESTYLDRWTGPGTSNSEPRVTNGGHNYLMSERWLEDGSYLRLRNASIGYTLPDDLSQRLNLEKMRIYISGTNLYTLTEYTGWTPEIGTSNYVRSSITTLPSSRSTGDVLSPNIDRGNYPVARTINLGVDITF